MAGIGESMYLSLQDRPKELKKLARAMPGVNSWSHNGETHNYRFGKLDGKNLVSIVGGTRDRMNLLDVGCGAGAFLHECASDMAMSPAQIVLRGVTGSDEVSEEMRQQLGDNDQAALQAAIKSRLEAKAGHIDLKIFENVCIEDLEHSSAESAIDFIVSKTRFDLIFCSWTALHIRDPFGMLVQLYDMLDVGGIVVLNMFFGAAPLGQVQVLADLHERGYDLCVDLPDLAEEAEDRGCTFHGIDIGMRKTASLLELRVPLQYTRTIGEWGRVFGSGLQNDEAYSVEYARTPPEEEPPAGDARRGRCPDSLATWAFGASERSQQALLDAVERRDLAAVKRAVAKGAVPSIPLPNGSFAVEMAVQCAFGNGAKELLALTQTLGASSRFCCAAAAGGVPAMKAMLASNPRLLNDAAIQGVTPLMAAAMCGRGESLCFVLHSGAAVEKVLEGHSRRPTALGLVASMREPVDLSVFCILLGHGADWRKSFACPALHTACTAGRLDAVREIIAASVDRESGLVAQFPWCGHFPMGLAMREVELAASGGVFEAPGGRCGYFPNHERKAADSACVEIVKELYPVTADDAPGGDACFAYYTAELHPGTADAAPSLKQEAAAFLEKYGVAAATLVSSVAEGVRESRLRYGDQVRIEGLKSATVLNGSVGFCCGVGPTSSRIRVSLVGGLKLVKAENVVGPLPPPEAV